MIKNIFLGKPRPELTWWKDMKHNKTLIDDTYEIEGETVKNLIKIGPLKRDNLMSTYLCEASNTNLTQPGTVGVKIDMNCKSEIINTKINHSDLFEGSLKNKLQSISTALNHDTHYIFSVQGHGKYI